MLPSTLSFSSGAASLRSLEWCSLPPFWGEVAGVWTTLCHARSRMAHWREGRREEEGQGGIGAGAGDGLLFDEKCSPLSKNVITQQVFPRCTSTPYGDAQHQCRATQPHLTEIRSAPFFLFRHPLFFRQTLGLLISACLSGKYRPWHVITGTDPDKSSILAMSPIMPAILNFVVVSSTC